MMKACLPLFAVAASLAACSTPPAPQAVGVAGAAPKTTAAATAAAGQAPAAGTGAADAAVTQIFGMPIQAIVNGKPLGGYDLTILDPVTDKPLPVLSSPPASGSAIVASSPPKTGADGSFKFMLVLDKAAGVISNGGGALIASGGGNLIASGGGNLIASGGGNLIASGGGNLIASGGGNLIASGGGNLIASGGGNLIASGGGNLIASGGGNLTSGGDVNLRVVAAGLGGRVEAMGALGPAGFGRVYRTFEVSGSIIMNVASTITAHLDSTVIKDSEKLDPEARQKARADATKLLDGIRTDIEKALTDNPDLASKILESGADGAVVDSDALIGQFLASTGLAKLVPGMLSPSMAAAVKAAGTAPDFQEPPISANVDLH
ncbi:MAG: hypothetical protein JWM80_2182 [Cyanobacteria bacterium RYN_339]|nr:hypothetical protein [Cyanobacteria bacterium RYN_339]